MAKQELLIKFKQQGSKELIAALKTLATQQRKLEGGLTKLKVAQQKIAGSQIRVAASTKTLTKVQQKQGEATLFQTTSNRLLTKENLLLSNSFAVLRSKMLLASFAAMLIEQAFTGLVRTYGKQQAVNEKLRQGLSNVQGTVEGVTQRLLDYSSALQKTTAFGDELITNGMVQLTTFGLNEEAMKSLTPQILNVARAIQTTGGAMPDLNSLFIAFGKATTTGIGTLTRYGVVLTDTEQAQLKAMSANEKAVEIGNILERQYGGLAEAYAKTTAGMLESAAAARGDAAEAMGEALAPVVLAAAKAFKFLFEVMDAQVFKTLGVVILSVTAGLTAYAAATLAANVAIGLMTGSLLAMNATMMANPYLAAAAAIGLAMVATVKYFGLFENEPITDATKAQMKLTNSILEQIKAIEKLEEATNSAKREEILRSIQLVMVNKELFSSTEKYQEVLTDLVDKYDALSPAAKRQKEIQDELKKATEEEEKLRKKLIKAYEAQEKANINEQIKILKDQIVALNDAEKERLRLLEEQMNNQKALKGSYEEFTGVQFAKLVADEKEKENIAQFISEYPEAANALGLFTEAEKQSFSTINKFSKLMSDSIINANDFEDAISATSVAFRKALTSMAVEMASRAALFALFSGLTGGAGAFAMGNIGKFALTGGVAHKGGLIKDDGRVQRFATGGSVKGGDNVPILAQGGEYVMQRSAVQSIGIENLNRMNQSGGGSVTVNVSGNVMSQDYVEGELAGQIKEAVRRGNDFGVS